MSFNFLAFSQDPLFWVKIILGILLFLYTIFAFIMWNQARSMQKLVDQFPMGLILSIIAFLHFLAALSLFIYTFAIL